VLPAIGTGAVAHERVDSRLISDLRNSPFRADLVLGALLDTAALSHHVPTLADAHPSAVIRMRLAADESAGYY
jgi:hypothetical protein